jgi:uncharacterized protein (DUF433 family)/DNA-binding transcriptional MerR regulator
MADQESLLQPTPLRGALRSSVVARLVGFPPRRLRKWHEVGILQAHEDPGARGYPRLYSWVDYMKLRAALKLQERGVPTRALRHVLAKLEATVTDWYLVPLHVWGGRVLGEFDAALVDVTSDQTMLPFVRDMLVELRDEGPLGELREFSDIVDMDPAVVSGNPVVRGTRLETRFIAELAKRGVPVDGIARRYELTPAQVQRVIEFDELVA